MAVSAPTTVATFPSTASVTTSGAITATAGAAAGSFLLVRVGGGGASQTFGVSDSLGNTYTALTAGGIASGSASTVQLFYCFTSAAVVSGTTTFTVTKSASGGLEFMVDAFTGVDTTTPIGNSGVVATGTSTTAVGTGSTSAAVTAVAGGSVEAVVVADITKAVGATSPMVAGTVVTSSGTGNPRRIAALTNQTASTGSVTPSFTLTSSGLYGVVAIVLNPLASGGASITATAAVATAGATVPVPVASGAANVTATAAVAALGAVQPFVMVRPTLAIIGDSLTERATSTAAPPTRESATRALLQAALWPTPASTYWYGKGGKGMAGADANGITVAQNITAARVQTGGVTQWLIALVTNNWGDADATFSAEVKAVLDLIYPTGSEPDLVYWVNGTAMNPANSNVAHYNPLLQAAISAHAQAAKITYLDFNTYIHAAGVYDAADWVSTDIPHMTTQGYAKRDAFIVSALQGGANVGGTAAPAAAGASAAVISAGASVVATAAVSLSGATSPTISAGAGVTATAAVIDPEAGSPSLSVGSSLAAAAAVGTAGATTPTVSVGGSIVISPTAASPLGSASRTAPTVTTGASVTVTTTAAAAPVGILTTTYPVVTAAQAVAISASAAAGLLAPTSPVVVVNSGGAPTGNVAIGGAISPRKVGATIAGGGTTLSGGIAPRRVT